MKGAYQVGCIKAIFESGFEPDMIYGISVGALNSTYLANESGRRAAEGLEIDWPAIGRELLEFWIRNITRPQDVALLRPRLSLGFNTLLSRYEGLLDPSPLHNLIRKSINTDYLRKSPVKLKISAVNVMDGQICDATPDHPDFIEYMMASSAIPLLMPAIPIGGADRMFLDGGLREVAPVRQAVADGATELVVVACHSQHIQHTPDFSPLNFISLLERVREITVNQIVNSDIEWIQSYADRSSLRGNPIKLTVIRPHEPLVLDLQRFEVKDISKLIVEGYKIALEALKKANAPA